MGILQLIASRNFITVNKDLIKTLGLEEAVLFGELCSEYDYWEKQEQLKDGYFFSTIENIENNTTLSEHKQRKALEKLKKLNIIETKVMGIPAKRYIKINEEQVLEFFNGKFLKNLGTETLKIQELDTQNLSGNNNITNNNQLNNNIFNIPELDKVFNEWLQYKAEKKQSYKGKGLTSLINKIKKQLEKAPVESVIEDIENCMANNYQGIFFKQQKENDPFLF